MNRVAKVKHFSRELASVLGRSILSASLLLPTSTIRADSYQIDAIVQKVEQLRRESLLRKARDLLRRNLQAGVDDPVLRALLADIYLSENEYERAERVAREAIKASPNYPWPYLLLAKAQLNLNRYKESLITLLTYKNVCKAAKQKPQDFHFLTGLNQFFLGRHEQAEANFAAAQSNVDDAALPFLLEIRSWNLRQLNQVEKSESLLKILLKKYPRDPRYKVLLAKHYNDRRLFDRAYRAMRKAVAQCDRTKDACSRFKEAYDEDFFSRGELAGVAPPAPELPFAVGLGFARESAVSDGESLALGLRTQKISTDDRKFLVPPKLNRINAFSSKLSTFGLGLPVAGLIYNRREYLNKDTSLPYSETDLLLKTEYTWDTGLLGDLTLFPGIRFYQADGRRVDNENLDGDKYYFVKPMATFTFLLSPWHGWTYLEWELAWGRFYETKTETQINENLQRIQVAQRIYGHSFIKGGYTRSQATDITSGFSRTRQSVFAKLEFLFKHLELKLSATQIYNQPTQDGKNGLTNVNTEYESNLGIGLADEVMISGYAKLVHHQTYEIYDHTLFGGRLTYYFTPRLKRTLAGRSLTYSTRLRAFAGLDQVRFAHDDWDPDRDFVRNDRVYVAGFEWR